MLCSATLGCAVLGCSRLCSAVLGCTRLYSALQGSARLCSALFSSLSNQLDRFDSGRLGIERFGSAGLASTQPDSMTHRLRQLSFRPPNLDFCVERRCQPLRGRHRRAWPVGSPQRRQWPKVQLLGQRGRVVGHLLLAVQARHVGDGGALVRHQPVDPGQELGDLQGRTVIPEHLDQRLDEPGARAVVPPRIVACESDKKGLYM